jgi:hypothetical protein
MYAGGRGPTTYATPCHVTPTLVVQNLVVSLPGFEPRQGVGPDRPPLEGV